MREELARQATLSRLSLGQPIEGVEFWLAGTEFGRSSPFPIKKVDDYPQLDTRTPRASNEHQGFILGWPPITHGLLTAKIYTARHTALFQLSRVIRRIIAACHSDASSSLGPARNQGPSGSSATRTTPRSYGRELEGLEAEPEYQAALPAGIPMLGVN